MIQPQNLFATVLYGINARGNIRIPNLNVAKSSRIDHHIIDPRRVYFRILRKLHFSYQTTAGIIFPRYDKTEKRRNRDIVSAILEETDEKEREKRPSNRIRRFAVLLQRAKTLRSRLSIIGIVSREWRLRYRK